MKRECTETENRIIRENVTDTTLFETNTSNVLPALLGLVLGVAVGIPVAFAVKNLGKLVIEIVLAICIIVMVNICVFVWPKLKEKIARKRKSKHTLNHGTFQVNGGTVTGYFGNREDAWLAFAEDDLLDSYGKPYIISCAVQNFPEVKPGDRILLIYCDSGEYIPVPVSEKTQGMIPMSSPDYWDKTDKEEMISIPHPNAVCLDREAYRMNERETAELVKKCRSRKEIKVKNMVGIILLSFLVFMILGIAFIFLAAEEVIESLDAAGAVAVIMLAVWGLSTYGIARGVRAGLVKGLKKLEYRKRVLFHSMTTAFEGDMLVKELQVYEYISGNLETVTYDMNNNMLLPKNIKFGTVLYKYSMKADSGRSDVNYFGL